MVPKGNGPVMNSTIILFYKYVTIPQPEMTLAWQRRLCTELKIKGRIIIAPEGINATLGGSQEAIDQYQQTMDTHPLFGGIDFKTSPGGAEDFPRLRILLKDEIVRLGISPTELQASDGGRHLTPSEAHELLNHKPDDLVILDARNRYESQIGTFTGSLTPPIDNFRDLPAYIDAHVEEFKDKTVLMHCTGGIRCERASAYLKSKGVAKEVLQISGGIHRYVEQYPNGHFRGKNYVFDGRIALKANDDIVGRCAHCDVPYDDYSNCINTRCNKQILSCPSCLAQFKNSCSEQCSQLVMAGTVTLRAIPRKSSTPSAEAL